MDGPFSFSDADDEGFNSDCYGDENGKGQDVYEEQKDDCSYSEPDVV